MIVVSGVKDTGLCGGYWGNTENLGSRRRSKPVEALQIGKDDKKRRGSVGSVGSGVDTPQAKKTPQAKNNKKQVTKPEKKLENMDSSQSESELDTEQNSSKAVRGKKRKNEDTATPSQEKKAKTTKKEEKTKEELDEEDIKASFSDYDSGANETQPLSKTKRPNTKSAPDSPTKDAPLTSKQQCQQPWLQGCQQVSRGVSAVWQIPARRERWWWSALLPMMIIDGSILGRKETKWPLMLYSMRGR